MKFARLTTTVFKKYQGSNRLVVASITDTSLGMSENNKELEKEFKEACREVIIRMNGHMYTEAEIKENEPYKFVEVGQTKEGTKEQVVVRLILDDIYE